MIDLSLVRSFSSELLNVGEAAPGTKAEEITAFLLKDKLEALGLSVELYRFPCASWQEHSVELFIDGKRIHSIAMPPSPSGYVEGELVQVGEGDKFSCTGVEDKIALVGMTLKDPDYVSAQYTQLVMAGAKAVVFYDFVPGFLRRIVTIPLFSYADGPGIPPPIPAVSIKREDAISLLHKKRYVQLQVKSEYREEAVSTTIVGFNEKEPRLFITAHLDRWLSGAADDVIGLSLLPYLCELLKDQHEIAFVAFGAEEFGAPSYNPWYWAWGSRKFVEFLSKNSCLDNLLAVINIDVLARTPLTISSSGIEFLEAAKSVLGGVAEYELDSPYFDSFSFSSVGVPALTIHSLWKYVELYHTDGDLLERIEWKAVETAVQAVTQLARSIVEKKDNFFSYDSWKDELLSVISHASRFLKPPDQLMESIKSLKVDKSVARVLTRELIKVVCEGELLEPRILTSRAFPSLLVLNDLELLDKFLNGQVPESELANMRRRWTAGEVRELPAIMLEPLTRLFSHMGFECVRDYLLEVRESSIKWLEKAYIEVLDVLKRVKQ
ncbi:MAG: M28 family peptidase [Thermofilaceae archaeon]|nr:M28 family peptidase [Thermofilaceae archaeon]